MIHDGARAVSRCGLFCWTGACQRIRSPCEPFVDDFLVGGYVLEQDIRRPVGVVGVCGFC